MGKSTHGLVLILGIFLASFAFANQAPVVDTFIVSPVTVPPGTTATFDVMAHDPDCTGTCTSGCGLYIRSDLTQWSVNGGAFLTTDNGTSGSPYSASAQWQAPASEGTYTATVSLSDSGSILCGNRQTTTANVTILVTTSTNHAPVIDSLSAEKNRLLIGDSATIAAVASDPDGDPVTFSWTTDKGTITPTVPGAADFNAPGDPGMATITCTVSDDQGAFASKTLNISVTGALPEAILYGGLAAPQDVSVDSYGYLFVADRRTGGVAVVKAGTDKAVYRIPVDDVTSVAVDWSDNLLIGTHGGARVANRFGTVSRFLNSNSPLGRVQDVAVDKTRQLYAVLYGGPGRVVVFDSEGNMLLAFGSNGENPGQFRGAVSLAITDEGDFVVGDSGHGLIHIFDPDGNLVRSFGGRGSQPGEFVQMQGLAVTPAGVIYVLDSFNSQVQAFNPDGTVQEVFGEYGAGLGQFMTPSGVALMGSYSKLVVTSLNASSLQVFKMPGSTEPPVNMPPSVPTLLRPADGAVLSVGSPVLLEAVNSFDPDFQLLFYTFELYRNDGGTLTLVRSWMMPEGPGTTMVDVSNVTAVGAVYEWRVRVWDGVAFSEWAPQQSFSVQASAENHAPGAPFALCPSIGFEVANLTPTLYAQNATDLDGDALSYKFEVALLVNGVYKTIVTSTPVQEGSSFTFWQVPAGVLKLSQQIYWRSKVSDGLLESEWSEYADFRTPPIPIPNRKPYGNLPSGDRTRPGEVRYSLDPRSVDTIVKFRVYDITTDTELKVVVNGLFTYPVRAQVPGGWSPSLSILIPASQLDPTNLNKIEFIHANLLDYWGVKRVKADPPPVEGSTVTDTSAGSYHVPDSPIPLSPIGGAEVNVLLPLLEVGNASDPDGDALNYIFELALLVNDCYQTIAVSPLIPEQQDTTVWQAPMGAIGLSQQVFWRALATDGLLVSEWTAYQSFQTPPIPVPSNEAYGRIPGDDQTRGNEVRYLLEPGNTDTIIYFRIYDVAVNGELVLEVNGIYAHPIPAQVADGWSTILSITIPANELSSQNVNLLRFVHQGYRDPWGVQGVSLIPGAVTGGNP